LWPGIEHTIALIRFAFLLLPGVDPFFAVGASSTSPSAFPGKTKLNRSPSGTVETGRIDCYSVQRMYLEELRSGFNHMFTIA
jgi:hypothetical protein